MRILQEGWSQYFTITGLQVKYTVRYVIIWEMYVIGVIIFPLPGDKDGIKLQVCGFSGLEPVVLETQDITCVSVTADIRARRAPRITHRS